MSSFLYDDDSDYESQSSDDLIFSPCPGLTGRFHADELVDICEDCGRFYAKCCMHRGVCHHSRIVFTDGACLNNGARNSVSGIGVAFGRAEGDPDTGKDYQFSIPIDDRLDPGERRTNQRAELLAAIQGLKKTCKHDKEEFLERMEEYGSYLHPESPEIIIATDSEYVVKGITEWLPRWKENGLRKSNGERPSNLDLFLDLEAAVEACQYRYGCRVEFWRIERRFNSVADELAKRAARSAGAQGRATYEFTGYAVAF